MSVFGCLFDVLLVFLCAVLRLGLFYLYFGGFQGFSIEAFYGSDFLLRVFDRTPRKMLEKSQAKILENP